MFKWSAAALATLVFCAPAQSQSPALISDHEVLVSDSVVKPWLMDLVDDAFAKVNAPAHFDRACIKFVKPTSAIMSELANPARVVGDEATGGEQKQYILLCSAKFRFFVDWHPDVRCQVMQRLLQHEIDAHVEPGTDPDGTPAGPPIPASLCEHATDMATFAVETICQVYIKDLMEFHGCQFPLPAEAQAILGGYCEWYVFVRNRLCKLQDRMEGASPPEPCPPTVNMLSLKAPCTFACIVDGVSVVITLCG